MFMCSTVRPALSLKARANSVLSRYPWSIDAVTPTEVHVIESAEFAGRRHARVRYSSGLVRVRATSASPVVLASLVDISLGGCRIAMTDKQLFQPSQLVELRLDLTSLHFRTFGDVRFVSMDGKSIGLEFHPLKDGVRSELEDFVAYLVELQ